MNMGQTLRLCFVFSGLLVLLLGANICYLGPQLKSEQRWGKMVGAFEVAVGNIDPSAGSTEESVVLPGYWPSAIYQELPRLSQPSTIKILYWTPQSKNPVWFGLGRSPFLRDQCPVDQCETTDDVRNLSSSHVVLFHQSGISKRDLPASKQPGQKWILFMSESAAYDNSHNWTAYEGLFDAVADFRMESEIPRFGGYFVPKPSSPGKRPINLGRKPVIRESNETFVAWFVSHCKTQSKREIYVEELQKHINVDVFGHCGPMECPRSRQAQCLDMLSEKYKFYLAFENSLCVDYVTEKVWNIFRHHLDVVPVLLGGANYSRFFPPLSYIDVLDFASPRHLAAHLHKLANKPELYQQHFEWRNLYDVHTIPMSCRICSYLHANVCTKSSPHADLTRWKNKTENCLSPREFYKQRLQLGT